MSEEKVSSEKAARVADLLKQLSVEFYGFLQTIAFSITFAVAQAFVLYVVCRSELEQSDAVCKSVSTNDSLKAEVQTLTTNFNTFRKIVETVPAVILAMFLGAWSDRFGRRLLLLLPSIGSFFSTAVITIATFSPQNGVWLLYLAAVFRGFGGGFILFMVGTSSLTADKSTAKQRTIRLALLDFAFLSALPLGSYLSGVLFVRWGYGTVYLCSLTLSTLSIIYALLCIKDRPVKELPFKKSCHDLTSAHSISIHTISLAGSYREGSSSSKSSLSLELRRKVSKRELMSKSSTEESIILSETKVSKKWSCNALFGLENFCQSAAICIRRREDGVRRYLLLILLAFLITDFAATGEVSVSFMYPQLIFNWTESDYSLFMAYGLGLSVVGIGILLPVYSNILEVPDILLLIFVNLSRAITDLLMGMASSEWMYFIAGSFFVIGSWNFTLARSALSTFVKGDEIAKIFVVIGCLIELQSLVSTVLYNEIYRDTKASFPGAVYFLSNGLDVVAASLFCFIYIDMKRQNFRGLSSSVNSSEEDFT